VFIHIRLLREFSPPGLAARVHVMYHCRRACRRACFVFSFFFFCASVNGRRCFGSLAGFAKAGTTTPAFSPAIGPARESWRPHRGRPGEPRVDELSTWKDCYGLSKAAFKRAGGGCSGFGRHFRAGAGQRVVKPALGPRPAPRMAPSAMTTARRALPPANETARRSETWRGFLPKKTPIYWHVRQAPRNGLWAGRLVGQARISR